MRIIMTMLVLLSMASAAWAQHGPADSLRDILPIYPGSEIRFQDNDGGQPQAVVTSGDDLDAVVRFFRSILASHGWELVSGMNVRHGTVLTYLRDGRMLSVTAAKSENDVTEIVVKMEN